MFTLTALIEEIGELQQVTEKFYKKDLVVLYESSPDTAYARQVPVKFEVTMGRVDMLDVYSPGDTIEIKFDIDGRYWFSPKEQRQVTFNSLKPISFKLVAKGEAPNVYTSAPKSQEASEAAAVLPSGGASSVAAKHEIVPDAKTEPQEDDDLPF